MRLVASPQRITDTRTESASKVRASQDLRFAT